MDLTQFLENKFSDLDKFACLNNNNFLLKFNQIQKFITSYSSEFSFQFENGGFMENYNGNIKKKILLSPNSRFFHIGNNIYSLELTCITQILPQKKIIFDISKNYGEIKKFIKLGKYYLLIYSCEHQPCGLIFDDFLNIWYELPKYSQINCLCNPDIPVFNFGHFDLNNRIFIKNFKFPDWHKISQQFI